MKDFEAPLDDIFYVLDELSGVDDLAHWDRALARQVLETYSDVMAGEMAPLNASGDAEGCSIEEGRVKMPTGFAQAYRKYAADGWQGLSLPEQYGGQGLSGVLRSVCTECFAGANHSMQMVLELVPGASRVLMEFGTPEQQAALIPLLASGQYIATMCLTEPDAGSDLARIRCSAQQVGDEWLVDGEKIFISGGDQDISEGILHLVLARTGDAGVQGLSLFACRSHLADGSRNAVKVLRIEEKMGLHASPTCHLQFEQARAELIGAEGEGLRGMFAMMNHARIDVSLQGVGHASRALDIASAFANERVQGKGADGQSVTIDQHADVERMLDEMVSLTVGGRVMAYKTLVLIEGAGTPHLVNFLTPLVKTFCSEAGIRAAEIGQQVLGGYGYLTEYGLDQVYRDARITAIYEGTNGIHARALATREIQGRGGDEFEAFLRDWVNEERNARLETAFDCWMAVKESVRDCDDPLPVARGCYEITAKLFLLAIWTKILLFAEKSPQPTRYKRVAEKMTTRLPYEIEAASQYLVEQLN